MILFTGLFLSALPIAVVVFLVLAFIKNKDSESFEDKIRIIYMYLVIIVSLVMIVGGTITLFSNFLDVILPDTYNNINRSITSMFTSATVLFIAIPMFMYHNKKVKTI